MKLYRLLWILIWHALSGRLGDEVFVSVVLDNEQRTIGLVGRPMYLDRMERRERFCVLEAVCEDPGPWTEHPDPSAPAGALNPLT